jgi:hypothetical protein
MSARGPRLDEAWSRPVLRVDGAPVASGASVSSEGTHVLVVTASDLAGNEASDVRSFTLDLTPPQIAVSGVAEGQVARDAVTPVFTVTERWLASIDATLDGKPFASGTAVSEEGDHALAVTATDRAGNVTSRAVHFAIDRTAPQVKVGGVAEGDVMGAPVTPTFEASDVHLAELTATLDGVPFVSGMQVATEGDHVLVVTATDRAGNAATATVHFSIDYSPPTIEVAGVAAGLVAGAPPLSPVFGASDPHLASVSATLDGIPLESGAPVWTEGDHVLVVTASDTLGHSSNATSRRP